jgi:xanthine/uracil permease
MNMAESNSIIMVSVVVTVGTTLVAEQQDSKLTFKPIVGGWILGLILFTVATFADDLARLFAILIMVTALLVNGTKLFSVFNISITGNPTNPANRTLQTPTSRVGP